MIFLSTFNCLKKTLSWIFSKLFSSFSLIEEIVESVNHQMVGSVCRERISLRVPTIDISHYYVSLSSY